MANKDYNKEDGVWRTIGGRRVFIRNGQSLADAMKESGKFKSAKKKPEYGSPEERKEYFAKSDEEKAEIFNKQMDKKNAKVKAKEEGKKIEYFNGDTILDELGSDAEGVSALYEKLGFDGEEIWDKVVEDAEYGNLYKVEKDGKNYIELNKDGQTLTYNGRASDNTPIINGGEKEESKKELNQSQAGDPYDDPESEESQRLQNIQSRYDEYLQQTEGRGASYGELAHIEGLRGKELDDFEKELDDFESNGGTEESGLDEYDREKLEGLIGNGIPQDAYDEFVDITGEEPQAIRDALETINDHLTGYEELNDFEDEYGAISDYDRLDNLYEDLNTYLDDKIDEGEIDDDFKNEVLNYFGEAEEQANRDMDEEIQSYLDKASGKGQKEADEQAKMDEINRRIADHLANVSNVAKEFGDEKNARTYDLGSQYARDQIKGSGESPKEEKYDLNKKLSADDISSIAVITNSINDQYGYGFSKMLDEAEREGKKAKDVYVNGQNGRARVDFEDGARIDFYDLEKGGAFITNTKNADDFAKYEKALNSYMVHKNEDVSYDFNNGGWINNNENTSIKGLNNSKYDAKYGNKESAPKNNYDNLDNYEIYEKAEKLANETKDYELRSEINKRLDRIDRANKRGEGYGQKPTNELREILKNNEGNSENKPTTGAEAMNQAIRDKANKTSKTQKVTSEPSNGFDMRKYEVELKHDKGTIKLSTVASDEATARKMIMNSEGAPESAIVGVKDKGSILKENNKAMNDAIREKAGKKKETKSALPKYAPITEQGNSNRKQVSENIQAHILDFYDSPEDFIEQVEVFNNMPTKWHAGQEMAKQGFYDIYYDDQRKFLDDLKINPKGKKFSDDKVFDMYASLIGRETEKLYNRLKKNQKK